MKDPSLSECFLMIGAALFALMLIAGSVAIFVTGLFWGGAEWTV